MTIEVEEVEVDIELEEVEVVVVLEENEVVYEELEETSNRELYEAEE